MANGNSANAGNARGGPRKGGPPHKSKSKTRSRSEEPEEGGWTKKEYKRKWGNRSRNRKTNSSPPTKEKSQSQKKENALVEKILTLLEERLTSRSAK